MTTAKKIFILDTNVILHDSSCIHQFNEHDIVIPITVLEELDNFKKGNDSLNFHAREFSRTLDSLTGTRVEEDVAPELITRMYTPPYDFPSTDLPVEQELLPNEYLILRGERKSALAVYDDELNLIKHVDKVPAFGITPRNAEQTYALDAILNDNIRLVSLTGKARRSCSRATSFRSTTPTSTVTPTG